MEHRRWCVVFLYKGSSTNFHSEEKSRFFAHDNDMCEFLIEMEKSSVKYTFKDVYQCAFNKITKKDTINLMAVHIEQKELRANRAAKLLDDAREKLKNNLSTEEIRLLKTEGYL